MKTIIAGSRAITSYYLVDEAIRFSGFDITEVVSGGARGVDHLGEVWASRHNKPIKIFPANWNVLGKKAGFRRNIQMADYADALVAVWDGMSRGTAHMIGVARARGLKVFVWPREA